MKISEVKEMSSAELLNKLKDLKAELFNLRFQHSINQLDNPMRIVEVKRSIAQVMTIMRQKEIKKV
ncbi:MAG: 50S ribosomal protein L29 [Eubacteriales bacterium]